MYVLENVGVHSFVLAQEVSAYSTPTVVALMNPRPGWIPKSDGNKYWKIAVDNMHIAQSDLRNAQEVTATMTPISEVKAGNFIKASSSTVHFDSGAGGNFCPQTLFQVRRTLLGPCRSYAMERRTSWNAWYLVVICPFGTAVQIKRRSSSVCHFSKKYNVMFYANTLTSVHKFKDRAGCDRLVKL